MYAVQEAVWRQKTKEQKDNAFDRFLEDSIRERNVVPDSHPMEIILHGIKPSKQRLVNEKEQTMKEHKRKDKHFSLY